MDTARGEEKNSMIRNIFGMMINPSGVVKSSLEKGKWYLSVLLSAMAFALFLFQTGLDLYRTGQKGMDFVVVSTGVGFVYGLLIIPLMGVLTWGILKAFHSNKSLKWTIASFCLSYSGAFVYGIMGLIFAFAFSWKTSMAFGVTGVLWAIAPLTATVREMAKGKTGVSVLIATLYSSFILVTWAYFGNL